MLIQQYGNTRAAVLTEAQAEEIIRDCRDPARDLEFARRFRVGRTTVANIRRGRTWAWLRRRVERDAVQ